MKRSLVTHVVACGTVLLLAGCATSEGTRRASLPTPNPHQKIGAPYTIKGVTYVPREDPGYDRTGIASWYGPNFHGKLTANGELFDQHRLTAAHKTLPLPSLVRVTNTQSGRSAVLRVNDRGPFAGDRIIDLSRAAAERLGTRRAGLAEVRVEYLGPAPMRDAIVSLGERQREPDAPRVRYASVEARPAPSLQTPDVAVVRAPRADGPERPVLDALPPAPAVPVPVASVPTAAPSPSVPTPRPAPRKDAIRVVRGEDTAPVPSISPGRAASPDAPAVRSVDPALYYVQVAAFGSAENAATASGLLPDAVPIDITAAETPGGPVHRLRIGPYAHEFPAVEALGVARAAGFPDAHLITE